jgi:hypothetical protein
MSAYRYLIFPRGRQPAEVEVRRLQEFAGALANQFAWGVCRDDGRLAVAFDARAFDHVASQDAGFEALVMLWREHGAELVEHLKFVKDATALKPTPSGPVGRRAESRSQTQIPAAGSGASATPGAVAPRRHAAPDQVAAAKRAAADESAGRSLLRVQPTLERYAALERLGAVFPYILMLAAIAATAGVGYYVHGRLSTSSPPRRQEAIEHIATEPPPDAAESTVE